jgi:hypothetical protein
MDKHRKAIREDSSTAQVTKYFIKGNSKSDSDVAATEGAFAFPTIKHHHSCESMDCTFCLLQNIFPDSKAAQHFSSARTKTENMYLHHILLKVHYSHLKKVTLPAV